MTPISAFIMFWWRKNAKHMSHCIEILIINNGKYFSFSKICYQSARSADNNSRGLHFLPPSEAKELRLLGLYGTEMQGSALHQARQGDPCPTHTLPQPAYGLETVEVFLENQRSNEK